MKIAVVSPFDVIGGAESYSLNLARALAKLDNFVTLYANSDQTSDVVRSKNLRTAYVRSKIFSFDPGNPVSIDLIRSLLRERYDIIHVHQMYSFFNLTSSFSARVKRTPIVLTDHGGGWRLAAFPHITANSPKGFAAVSRFSLEHLLHFAPRKQKLSRVVYGGVNTDLFYPKNGNEELRKHLDVENNRTVLCLGRVLPHKGIDTIIRAFQYLPPDMKLLVVGQLLDLDYLAYLKTLTDKYCKGRVIFTDAVSESTLPDYYNLCDVYVQSSLYVDFRGRYHRFPELLGLSRLEAMACAKPVVVSRAGGLPEKIIQGRNGFVFEPGDAKKLADYVNLLLSDGSLRRNVGSNALKTVQQELTWLQVARRSLDLYNLLIEN